MEVWVKASLLLCLFGFLKEFRPSEPFVTNFLLGPWKNFTTEQVNQEIYVVGTYSYLAVLVIIFLVTDILRYKPVIILTGITGIATWTLLTWGQTIPLMQCVEFLYGVFMASEIAYFTYIYAKVDRSHYQRVTSYTRAAYLSGRFVSSVTSQVLVSTSLLDYLELNYLTIGAMVLATICATLLPPVSHSIYFHREANNNLNQQPSCVDNTAISVLDTEVSTEIIIPKIKSESVVKKLLDAYSYVWKDFKSAYTNLYVVKWSFWWSIATCGFLQVLVYIQVLWDVIVKDSNKEGEYPEIYNAAVEASYTLIGAAASFCCGWLQLNWQLVGEVTLAACSLIQGAALLVSATTNSLWLSYGFYIIFGILYHTMMTVTSSEVAKHINEDSYGLVFGLNTFFALVLQSILSAIVVGSGGLELNPRDQYLVYGSYFVVLGTVFIFVAIYTMCCKKTTTKRIWLSADLDT